MFLFFIQTRSNFQSKVSTSWLTFAKRFPPVASIVAWHLPMQKVFTLKLSFLADENNPLSQTIPDTPTELKFFIKLCEQRRKFPVLYKIEFSVSELWFDCFHSANELPFAAPADCSWKQFKSTRNEEEQSGEESEPEDDSLRLLASRLGQDSRNTRFRLHQCVIRRCNYFFAREENIISWRQFANYHSSKKLSFRAFSNQTRTL